MKLFNHSKLDDNALKEILIQAAKSIGGIRTRNVVIKITTSHYRLRGRAERCGYSAYCLWWLRNKHGPKVKDDKLMLRSDGGYLFLHIPIHKPLELLFDILVYRLVQLQ